MTSITCASSRGYVGCRADDSTKAPLLRATCAATAWGGPARYAVRERGEAGDFSVFEAGLARRRQSFSLQRDLSRRPHVPGVRPRAGRLLRAPSVIRASRLLQPAPAMPSREYHVDSCYANETSWLHDDYDSGPGRRPRFSGGLLFRAGAGPLHANKSTEP